MYIDIDVYFQFTQTVSHITQCTVPTSHFVKWLHQIVFRYALLLLNECGCGDYSVVHKCIIYLSILHAFLVLLFLVPATPTHLNVCAVYDMVNETLQIIESSWNEVVCCVCKEWSPAVITFKLVLNQEHISPALHQEQLYDFTFCTNSYIKHRPVSASNSTQHIVVTCPECNCVPILIHPGPCNSVSGLQ